MKKRILSLFLVVAMIITMLPVMAFSAAAVSGNFTATSAPDGKNYATLSWQGAAGSKYAITKSNGGSDIYETIPLKYSIKVLNVYPNVGNNLKGWMQLNGMGSPLVDGTQYNMTVDEVAISYFNVNPSTYLGIPGNWKYDVVYFGGYDSNNNYDISSAAYTLTEQFIKSGGGVLLGHDTAAFNNTYFKYLGTKYLDLQIISETYVSTTSPDYIPRYGNTKVKVARKGLLTNYPYSLGDVGTVMTTPESHTYCQFSSGNIWFSYDGSSGIWDPSRPELTYYKGKTGTNNFYLTTLNNVAMIQTGHSNGYATTDEQKILTNTLYYLAQTTNQTTFDDHSAQDLTAPSKVSGSVTVSGSNISFADSVDAGNVYSYKLYTVDDVNGIKTDTGETAQATVKTGIKGYSYVINQTQTAVGVDTSVEVTSAAINASTLTPGNYYLHIRSVDNAGNASEESVLPFTIKSTLPSGSVTLNKPIFNNDKSGYSFKSATIKNFTGINSITFSITKGTTVKSIPTFLTPSSKLESIDGDTRTFTYVYEKGVTVSQAEEFIRGIVFNYVAGAEISITVDNNVTKLPNGAKITKFAHPDGTDHYYMFVATSGTYPWATAYNNAKSYRYMGMIGYLATITSKDEDNTLTNISKNGAWSGGTRLLKSNGTKINDELTYTNYTSQFNNQFYWACGPEAGTVYFTGITYSTGSTPSGMYSNWQINEPNNYTPVGYEQCMQVNFTGDYNALLPKWNDINNSGDVIVTGYFVEFSNYAGGVESAYASDKTAVGLYNIATGGVEEAATVTLNAPVYGVNKSEFSFNNAEIKNISTIYSLTIKLDNYTSILSKPAAPAVTNELSNIAGATNTITYQFKDGITQAEAQSFLRGLKFRYGGLKTSSTTNVSVTVDGNKTNLPTGANITEFNGHYYMYVPSDFISWTNAYNKAKSYTFMGLNGYLATITSQEEDKILTNISKISAWSAGTRYLNADGSTLANPTSVTGLTKTANYYYWACGPEAGTIYYNSTSPTSNPGAGYTGYNSAYNNWGTQQPDANKTTEVCMQVNWPYDTGAAGQMRWNDLPYDGLPNIDLVKGYFVEFSDYEGGRVEGFTQSANGASTVPITVEKGDVFNTIKNGGTYYTDIKLTAFDRNITKITVNGGTFLSGDILAGNTNTTYNIVATDLDGNTAMMTVYMKTISSISQPISGLTVNNVQMSNKDTILAVKAALMAIDTTDVSTAQKTEINNAIQNCKNLYFALFNAAATALNGTNGWYKNGIGAVTLTAPAGFEISTSATGTWTNSITLDKADGANKTASYYLKETATGDISSAKTFSYKVDTIAPTGTITIKNNAFKSFINTISFGLFYKNRVDVFISGTDTLSTPVTISYQKVKYGEIYNEGGTWTSGSSFAVMANEKFSVYAKITDNAGNVSIINTNGVVVYTDSTQGTANITFTKTSTDDYAAIVNLNGNTVKDIKNGVATLTKGTDYTVSNGIITMKASYLDSLAVGTYTLTISYNPMGESYVTGGDNQAPAATTITLAIKAKNMSENGGVSPANVTVTSDSMVYSGNDFIPSVTVKDGTKTLVAGTDYTISWTSDMTSVGEKTLTITFKGDYSGSVTKKVTVTNAVITDTTAKTQSASYNKNAQTATTPAGVTVNNQPLTVKYSYDGGTTYNQTLAPQFTSAGVYTVYYQLSAPNHNAVTGQITFTIQAATDNAVTKPVISGWTYDATPNTPTAAAIYGSPVFTYSNSENGTYTSTVPTAAGTYFVKASVAATADYNGCEATASFVISKKAVNNQDISIGVVNGSYLYTGGAITPEPTVTVNNKVLIKDVDYTVTFENNTQIGTNAKVKITLKGNYSGETEKTFEIRYGTINENDIKNVITLLDSNSESWYNKDIVITAAGDWKLFTTPNGTFGNTLTISNESAKAGNDYTFYIKAPDGTVYERTLHYMLDKTAPEGSIGIEKSGLKSFLKTITFGLLFNVDVDVTVTASDNLSEISKIEVYKADKELTAEQIANIQWSVYTSAIQETAKDAERFIYYARITDKAGNTVVVNSEGATFDTTAPVISGITNGETYYTTQKVTITDVNYDTVTVNGKAFESSGTIAGNTSATYTIVATDKAGNTTTVTVTMKPLSDIQGNLNNITEDVVKSEDQQKIEDVKKKAEAVDKTNATAEEKAALQKIIDKCNSLLKKIEENNSPKTGDSGITALWIILLFISGGAITTLSVFKKRRRSFAK